MKTRGREDRQSNDGAAALWWLNSRCQKACSSEPRLEIHSELDPPLLLMLPTQRSAVIVVVVVVLPSRGVLRWVALVVRSIAVVLSCERVRSGSVVARRRSCEVRPAHQACVLTGQLCLQVAREQEDAGQLRSHHASYCCCGATYPPLSHLHPISCSLRYVFPRPLFLLALSNIVFVLVPLIVVGGSSAAHPAPVALVVRRVMGRAPVVLRGGEALVAG